MKRKPYLKQKLTYTDTGKLLDENGRSVMMDWETEWMRESANVVCSNGGDILNIGFGMGIIDTFIQGHNIKSHTIIEAHPDVYQKMIEDGWDKKPNVTIIYSLWQDVIHKLPKYDGIYFDTWADKDHYTLLFPAISKILKPNGIFSYWEGRSDNDVCNYTKSILYSEFDFDKKIVKLDNVPTAEEQFENETEKDNAYFPPEWSQCVIPIITHRKTKFIKPLL